MRSRSAGSRSPTRRPHRCAGQSDRSRHQRSRASRVLDKLTGIDAAANDEEICELDLARHGSLKPSASAADRRETLPRSSAGLVGTAFWCRYRHHMLWHLNVRMHLRLRFPRSTRAQRLQVLGRRATPNVPTSAVPTPLSGRDPRSNLERPTLPINWQRCASMPAVPSASFHRLQRRARGRAERRNPASCSTEARNGHQVPYRLLDVVPGRTIPPPPKALRDLFARSMRIGALPDRTLTQLLEAAPVSTRDEAKCLTA